MNYGAMTIETETSLDEVDRQILAELQADGRMTNVELARRVGLSAPPCLRRVRRLEEEHIIRGYHADLDPVALGYEITFFAPGRTREPEGCGAARLRADGARLGPRCANAT